MKQKGLTVITPIKADRLTALHSMLGNAAGAVPFRNMTTVHYAAFLVLPSLDDCPPRLVLETNYDGDLSQHLDELIEHGRSALDQIYDLCEDYPPSGAARDPEGVKQYFKKHSVMSAAFFIAFPGRALGDIRNAIDVYQEAKRFLDDRTRTLPSIKKTRDQYWEELVEYFRSRSPIRPQRSPVTRRRLKRSLWLNLLILVAVFLLLVLAVPLLLLWLNHINWRLALKLALLTLSGGLALILLIFGGILLAARLCEFMEAHRGETPHDLTLRPVHQAVYEGLNVGPQNHLCTLATVKNGRLRMFMIKACLFVVNAACSKFFILGKLGQISTIHFARWILIDDNKRLLFLTNYDGSWSGYLNDFSDQGFGINAIWGNTVGFVPTKWLLWGGAYYLQPFEDLVLEHFHPAKPFYSAYYDYPVQNIGRYLEFRDALAEALV